MSPRCDNCGETVSMSYVRVFAPDGMDTVRCCPFCPDLMRATTPSGGEEIRETRNARRTSGNSGSRPTAEADRSLEWA